MQGFETVQQELDTKRNLLEQELQAAQGRVAEIRADLERVQEALEALIGPKKKPKAKARARKPAATVQVLQGHIGKVREEHPYASALELRKAVRALVREGGTSLAGFPTLFAQALLSSPGFSGSPGFGESTQPSPEFAALSQPVLGAHSEASPRDESHAIDSYAHDSHTHDSHTHDSSASSRASDSSPHVAEHSPHAGESEATRATPSATEEEDLFAG